MYIFFQVSYDVYLLHMAALYWFEAYVLPRGWLAEQVNKDPRKGYAIIYGGICVASYVCAVLHHTLHSKVGKLFSRR